MTITVMNFPLYFHHLVQRPNYGAQALEKCLIFSQGSHTLLYYFQKTVLRFFIHNEISTHYRQKLALPFFLRLLILTVSSLVFSQNLWEDQNSSVQKNQTAFSYSAFDKLSHVDSNEKIKAVTQITLITMTYSGIKI